MAYRIGALFIVCAFMTTAAARAGSFGELSGHILAGNTLAPIAGARVTAASPTSTYSATTNAAGYYSMVGVFPDSYAVTATANGFSAETSPDHTVNPDDSVTVNLKLVAVRTLATVNVRPPTSLVQPEVTADRYVLDARQSRWTNGATGSYGLSTVTGVISTLPGVTTDQFTFPHVRGGRENELTYEYDGVATTQPVTDAFATDRVNVGLTRMEVETGGYSAQEGSSISGVVNVVVDRGTYPPHGSVTLLTQSPTFYHGAKFDYGGATEDQRLSYYVAGIWWNADYDWGNRAATYPGAFGPGLSTPPYITTPGAIRPSADQVANLFYRFGKDQRDELELLSTNGYQRYEYKERALYFPSDNPSLGPLPASDAAINGFCSNRIALFPGQTSCFQSTGQQPDYVDFRSYIRKAQLRHDFSPASNLILRYAEIGTYDLSSVPFGLARFSDFWLQGQANQHVVSAEYSNQVNESHFVRLGLGRDDSQNVVYLTYPSTAGLAVDFLTPTAQPHAFLEDRYQRERLTVDSGLRFDQENYFPMFTPAFSKRAFEPRFAFAYSIGSKTVVRSSYGMFEQMPNVIQVEEIYANMPRYTDARQSNWFTADGAIPPLPPRESDPAAATSHALDASLEQELGGGWNLKVTPFWRWTTDLIVDFSSTAGSIQRLIPQNVGPYYVNGIEAEAQLHLLSGLSGFISYTHTRALSAVPSDSEQNLTNGAKAIHLLAPIDFVPEDAANVVLDYSRGKWEFNPEISYFGGYHYGVGRLVPCLGPEFSNTACANAPPGVVTFQPNSAFLDSRGNPIDITEGPNPNSLLSPAHALVNLAVYYNISGQIQAGMQVFNVFGDYAPIGYSRSGFYTFPGDPNNGKGPFGLDYGQSPYTPTAYYTTREFLFSLTARL